MPARYNLSMGTITRLDRANIDFPYSEVEDLCRKYRVARLAVFGSVLRDEFRSDSDIDFLVVFHDEDYGPWMSKLTGMQEELSRIVGRKVDLVPQPMLKWVIRDRVLGEARVVYEDGRPLPG